MNEFWDVLEIDGDMDEAQILFAHIKDYSQTNYLLINQEEGAHASR